MAPRPDASGLGVIVSSGYQLALELACVASDLISNISPNNRRPSTRLYNAERCTVLPSLGNDSRAAPSPREPTKLGPKPLISLRLPRLRTKNSEPHPNVCVSAAPGTGAASAGAKRPPCSCRDRAEATPRCGDAKACHSEGRRSGCRLHTLVRERRQLQAPTDSPESSRPFNPAPSAERRKLTRVLDSICALRKELLSGPTTGRTKRAKHVFGRLTSGTPPKMTSEPRQRPERDLWHKHCPENSSPLCPATTPERGASLTNRASAAGVKPGATGAQAAGVTGKPVGWMR